jgi:hypothetical protein
MAIEIVSRADASLMNISVCRVLPKPFNYFASEKLSRNICTISRQAKLPARCSYRAGRGQRFAELQTPRIPGR